MRTACESLSGVLEPKSFQLAIKRRAANLEPSRHFGHLSSVVRYGKTDGIPLNVLQWSDIAAGVDYRHRIRSNGDSMAVRIGQRCRDPRRRFNQGLGGNTFGGQAELQMLQLAHQNPGSECIAQRDLQALGV